VLLVPSDVASKEPNVTFVEGRVVDVVQGDAGKTHIRGVKWVNSSGKTVESLAPLSVLCDGYYSVLRKVCAVRVCVCACVCV
jgi:2-polyprenyl-6-methoxyphenol hydroxylase-like FAD-dependent oxidoreductase